MEAVGEVDLDKIFEASRDLRKEVSSTAEKERGRGKEDALTFPDLVLFLSFASPLHRDTRLAPLMWAVGSDLFFLVVEFEVPTLNPKLVPWIQLPAHILRYGAAPRDICGRQEPTANEGGGL